MKKKVGMLMAVVTMAATPAVADPPPQPARVDLPVAVRVLEQLSIALARPRTMPSGAPACGNVASRAPRPDSCDQPAPPRVITATADRK
jgi:hypothetical protein